MGLATIYPHSHKEQTKLYKISNFGVNRPNSLSKIQPFENVKIYKLKKCTTTRTLCPDDQTFLNACISVKPSLIITNVGILRISLCSF